MPPAGQRPLPSTLRPHPIPSSDPLVPETKRQGCWKQVPAVSVLCLGPLALLQGPPAWGGTMGAGEAWGGGTEQVPETSPAPGLREGLAFIWGVPGSCSCRNGLSSWGPVRCCEQGTGPAREAGRAACLCHPRCHQGQSPNQPCSSLSQHSPRQPHCVLRSSSCPGISSAGSSDHSSFTC